MELSRLTSLSYGESTLTLERWSHVKALETARKARLPVVAMPAFPADDVEAGIPPPSPAAVSTL